MRDGRLYDADMLEIAGPLDRNRLRRVLDARGIDPASYSLTGGHPSECCVLEDRRSERVVYYSERGLETGLRSFPSEDLACRHLADLLWRDPTARKRS